MPGDTLNQLYNELVEQVYTDDEYSQRYYLSMIEDQRKIAVDYLMMRKCMFIPNNDYITHYLGVRAQTYSCGLYDGDNCMWALFMVAPILDLVGDVVGIVGWDAENKRKELEEGEKGLPMYKVSSKFVFPRERYFLSDIELLRQEFSKRVIFIVDGVFDSISLNYHGIPAVSLLGSSVSPEVLYFLRWYKYIYVVQDNDSAGMSLYARLAKALPRVYRVVQNKTKDIEELLRTDGLNGPVTKQLLDTLNNPVCADVRIKI